MSNPRCPRPCVQTYCWLLIVCCGLSSGCGPRTAAPVASGVRDTARPLVVSTDLKLEVDPELAKNGLVVETQKREGQKLLLAIRSTARDHESTNYSYLLFDADGKQLTSSGFSGPSRKQDEAFEVEIGYEDMPTAARVVIAPFRPLKSAK